VQTALLPAVAEYVFDDADPGARRYHLPRPYGGAYGEIGRAERAVGDRHDTTACQIAGERDSTRSGGEDESAGRCGEIDSPVPGLPWMGRRVETAHDGRRRA
jgi:hypothetical protein